MTPPKHLKRVSVGSCLVELTVSASALSLARDLRSNETETIKAYRTRVRQADAIGHFALAELIRKIIVQEQEHQHDLATALGIEVPKVLEDGA